MQHRQPDLFTRFFMLAVLLTPVSALAQTGSEAAVPTRTTLTTSGSTLTAEVRTAGAGSPVAEGTVDFLLPGGQSLGSVPVGADGTATLTPATLPAATEQSVSGSTLPLTAVYNAPGGSSALSGSASFTTPILRPSAATVTPDFTVTGNPTTVTATRGSYGTTAITVTSVGGFTGSIQLSCTGLPAQVTCAFNPTQQILAPNGTFTTSLQLQTQGPSGTASSSLLPPSGSSQTGTQADNFALALAIPGAFLLIGFGDTRRRALRKSKAFGFVLLIAAGSLALSGCSQRYGYLKHPAPVAPGTPIGTFPITVAVDADQGASVTEHLLSVSLIVK